MNTNRKTKFVANKKARKALARKRGVPTFTIGAASAPFVPKPYMPRMLRVGLLTDFNADKYLWRIERERDRHTPRTKRGEGSKRTMFVSSEFLGD